MSFWSHLELILAPLLILVTLLGALVRYGARAGRMFLGLLDATRANTQAVEQLTGSVATITSTVTSSAATVAETARIVADHTEALADHDGRLRRIEYAREIKEARAHGHHQPKAPRPQP